MAKASMAKASMAKDSLAANLDSVPFILAKTIS